MRLRHLPGRRIGEADVADLAGVHQVVERAHGLVDGREPIPGVHPIEIDVVGLQPAERLLARGDDVLSTGPAGVRIARIQIPEELGGDDDAVAAAAVASDEVTDDFFRVALRVDVRGVDEIPAALDEARDDSVRIRYVRSPSPIFAEGHRAEAERTDAESGVSERDVLVE